MAAFYRKYRPTTLGELLGQEHITDVIKNAVIKDRLSHAYLFFGPRGTGKTTTARLIAKIACCEKRKSNKAFAKKGEPCNTCTPCTEIAAGRGIDVVEIDAASNRGIDEMRRLKEGIRLAPSSYTKKVFIIDETHMLTKEAFNALLKTLEEPPQHAIMILATTEIEKVPSTITSRSQRFHFKKLGVEKIAEKLQTIVDAEKIKADPEALELIASLADGSFRDAESLLDQLAALGEDITLEVTEKNLGRIGLNKTSELASYIFENDLKGAITFIKEINEYGLNVVDACKELIQYMRHVATIKHNPDLRELLKGEMTSKELKGIEVHAAKWSDAKHIPLIKSLLTAYSQMRYSPFASIPLEVALIEHLKEQ